MIRTAAVAGQFYPANPLELEADVRRMLAKSDHCQVPVKALIAPHAGYIYSGQVAARAYRLLENREEIRQVVLLGPAHYVYVEGLAVSSASHFSSPLGPVPLNRDCIEEIGSMPQVCVSDAAHAPEHSLEVHLPFLQLMLGEFQLVPILVGVAPAEQSAEVIDRLWGGEETLIVVSSDLSHFHPYSEAQQIDQRTSSAICHLSEQLQGEEACGCHAINGLMRCAKSRGLKASLLDICNSGDTAGDKERVVGYGAYELH